MDARPTLGDKFADRRIGRVGFQQLNQRFAGGETGDARTVGVVEWNLFDIDAKFGDVEPLERVLEYLEGIEPFVSRAAGVSVVSAT